MSNIIAHLFDVMLTTFEAIGEKPKYVFLSGPAATASDWLSVGPYEDPHTYPSLKEMGHYQGHNIRADQDQVYILFPVPRDLVRDLVEGKHGD